MESIHLDPWPTEMVRSVDLDERHLNMFLQECSGTEKDCVRHSDLILLFPRLDKIGGYCDEAEWISSPTYRLIGRLGATYTVIIYLESSSLFAVLVELHIDGSIGLLLVPEIPKKCRYPYCLLKLFPVLLSFINDNRLISSFILEISIRY